MGINNILNGHTNELFGLNKNISQARLTICRQCPLYKDNILLGEICNNKRWYNPNTKDESATKKDGYINGCGCRLKAKTTLANAVCPIRKW